MPFLANILTARLVEHMEEHGESIVKPDLTGPDLSTLNNVLLFSKEIIEVVVC